MLGPVVSNHGNLRAVPAPVARGWSGLLDHHYIANLGLGTNGLQAWHRKGEGGQGRGP